MLRKQNENGGRKPTADRTRIQAMASASFFLLTAVLFLTSVRNPFAGLEVLVGTVFFVMTDYVSPLIERAVKIWPISKLSLVFEVQLKFLYAIIILGIAYPQLMQKSILLSLVGVILAPSGTISQLISAILVILLVGLGFVVYITLRSDSFKSSRTRIQTSDIAAESTSMQVLARDNKALRLSNKSLMEEIEQKNERIVMLENSIEAFRIEALARPVTSITNARQEFQSEYSY
jgi:hypothetical protein